uniref:Phosphatidylinositol-3-phosphatase SAC1 n=1 Tax=Timema monikensis TaxID=170555 RepID=A0A7R9EAX6_9NEOP|nr:unnamed protein product [Timema monikensis]
MAVAADLHDDFILYVTPEKFYIEAVSGNELLVIDRVSQEISLQANHGQIPLSSSSKPICGIFGTIRLILGPYLVVITKKRKVGTINGQAVWQVTEAEIISYNRTILHLTEKQIVENRQYEAMFNTMLNTPYMYFSYSYDLTHSLQRLHNTTPEFLQAKMSKIVHIRSKILRCQFMSEQTTGLYGTHIYYENCQTNQSSTASVCRFCTAVSY